MRNQDIEEFVALTKTSRSTAKKYLSNNNWALEYALNDFYDTEQDGFISKPHPPELLALFNEYNKGDEDAISTDGLIKFMGDLDLDLEDPVTLCVADAMHCASLSQSVSKEMFIQGWHENLCGNLLQIKEKVSELSEKLRSDAAYFEHIYSYTYALVLEPNEKQLDLETAIAYWQLLFPEDSVYAIKVPQERLQSWAAFLTGNVTRIHYDVWNMFLKFARMFPDDKVLKQGYNENDAWPVLIDEYYEYLEEEGQL
ncbi:LAQU0S28e00496g1_1 [Lachancea quebecensis]|uniref:Defective in cullin neddylation protein n=1 Tax=Lachancea quebecensis TaxID=1654605 RepID=A0A0P1KYQ7_9SACH|nr:LAQU0S28e00496g1_1 [Lachancea quebecensis]